MKKEPSHINKTLKRILIIALSVIAGCGAVWGILTLAKNARQGEVNVYAVSDFAMTDYYGDSSETSGNVTTDRLQKVYISSTQTVKTVYVTEGQEVKKGDKLGAFDTTLSSLDLQRAQIAFERQQLAYADLEEKAVFWTKTNKYRQQLEEDKAELETKLNQLRKSQAESQGIDYPDPMNPPLPQGDGSAQNPFCYDTPVTFSETWMKEQLGKAMQQTPAEGAEPSAEYTACVLFVDKDAVDGVAYYIPGSGFKITGTLTSDESPEFTNVFMTPAQLDLPYEEGGDSPIITNEEIRKVEKELRKLKELLESPEVPETPADLEKLKNDLLSQLSAGEMDLKISRLELEKAKSEVQDGVVYSDIDGTVKIVRDATEAYNEGSPVVEISGGGGYYISGSISEMELGTVTMGQTVNVNSWMSGTSCEGEIVEISEYPTTTNTGWSNGNNNVSWYPIKVFVSDDANLQEGEWVNITYENHTAADGAWYLESMFIRTENGKSYVLLRGENGRLEQRWIQTGRALWGSYTEVRGGLTTEDYVAFPYGKGVEAGAKTVEATPDQLYNYY